MILALSLFLSISLLWLSGTRVHNDHLATHSDTTGSIFSILHSVVDTTRIAIVWIIDDKACFTCREELKQNSASPLLMRFKPSLFAIIDGSVDFLNIPSGVSQITLDDKTGTFEDYTGRCLVFYNGEPIASHRAGSLEGLTQGASILDSVTFNDRDADLRISSLRIFQATSDLSKDKSVSQMDTDIQLNIEKTLWSIRWSKDSKPFKFSIPYFPPQLSSHVAYMSFDSTITFLGQDSVGIFIAAYDLYGNRVSRKIRLDTDHRKVYFASRTSLISQFKDSTFAYDLTEQGL